MIAVMFPATLFPATAPELTMLFRNEGQTSTEA